MISTLSTPLAYFRDDTGAASVEYVVIAAALTMALVPGFYYVSSAMEAKFEFIIEFIMG